MCVLMHWTICCKVFMFSTLNIGDRLIWLMPAGHIKYITIVYSAGCIFGGLCLIGVVLLITFILAHVTSLSKGRS